MCDVGDYTSNVSPMWMKALGFPLAELDGRTACHVVGTVLQAVWRMYDNSAEYEALAPANGWGDVDGAREYLRRLAEACAKHPRATIRISR